MKQDIIEKLVRPMIRKVTPYRSARDEFKDFDAQKIFLDANENPFDNGVNRYPDPLQLSLIHISQPTRLGMSSYPVVC